MCDKIVGICSECGGRVTVPTHWLCIYPPVPTCQSCGATMERSLPIIPMRPRKPDVWPRDWQTDNEPPYKISRTDDDMKDWMDRPRPIFSLTA